MKANTSRSNSQHSPTLDLFAPSSAGDGAAPTPDPGPEALDAKVLPADNPGAGSNPEGGSIPEGGPVEAAWPALADVSLRRTEPFRVPGLKSIVVPVPVFRVKLVRERDHLTRQVHTPADAARLCSELLDGLAVEVFLVVAMSTANRIIGAHAAHQGTVDSSIASPREAMKFCLLCNARSFLIAHNHPSGNLEPSKADVAVSKQMMAAGEVVGVRLLDSLVVGFDGRYTSLSERGLL